MDEDNIGRDVEEEERKRVVINKAAEEDDDDNSDSPNLIALVSCKFAWNLVIEAMISVSLVWKVENISWISAELFLLRWVRGRPSWVPSPSWGLLTLACLNWETSRLVLAPFKQYVFNNNSMYSTQCLQLDILQSALDQDDPNHILCALPTGFGKTMPMLLLGHLLPPGAGIPILETPCYSKTFQARWRWSWFLSSRSSFSFSRTARDWA